VKEKGARMAAERSGRLDRGDGVELAWALREGCGPTVVFLPGFASDMAGAKAVALDSFCAARGQAMLRLDYSGHGQSGGTFAEGCIGRWLADALAVIDGVTQGKLLLVGSSMGGWIALLVALARRERIIGLVGIAAAPDFTETLIWSGLSPAARETLLQRGHVDAPSQYGPPLRLTRTLIEDGRRHLLLGGPIALALPVRLLQGQRDDDVPWRTALTLAGRIEGADVHVTLVKDGDHRLSRPEDLALLELTVAALLGQDAA
jgi:pimeloyl-ACP methyl ester carboxylesterase